MSKAAQIAAWTVAAIVAIVHLMAAGQYDIFRNELYFIVCGWHPAFGYIDQPPLIPLISALFWNGGHVWLLRIPAVIAAVALVPITVSFAELLGANGRGAWMAAVSAATATLIVALTATLGTSTFDAIAFTAVAYYITRSILKDEPRALWWAGVIAGISFEIRYGILMWAIGIFAGLLITGPRSILRSRDFWIGIGIAVIIALPNAIWQLVNGLPFLELVRNDSSGNLIGTPIQFLILQTFLINIVLVPLWVTGVIAPFISKRLEQFRFLSITFVVTAIVILASHGKAYYMAGAYPTMFALGSAAIARIWRPVVGLWAVLATLNAALALPFVLPVEPPEKLKATIDRQNFKMQPLERAGIGAPLMQVLSDEFGWRDLAVNVGLVYKNLPESDRANVAIFAENYGDASAINVFGDHLPTAISGNNNYYLWGPGTTSPKGVIIVNADPRKWATMCSSMIQVGTFGSSPYAMPYETNRKIYFCKGFQGVLQAAWPQFKHYGIENLGQDD